MDLHDVRDKLEPNVTVTLKQFFIFIHIELDDRINTTLISVW